MSRSLSLRCTKLRTSIVQWFCCPRGIRVRGAHDSGPAFVLDSGLVARCSLCVIRRVRTRLNHFHAITDLGGAASSEMAEAALGRWMAVSLGSDKDANAGQLADYATRKLYLTCLHRRCQCRVSPAHSCRSPAGKGERSTRSWLECLQYYAVAPCGATMCRGSGRWRGAWRVVLMICN